MPEKKKPRHKLVTPKPGDPNYWKWRSRVGNPKKMPPPKKVWQLACDYCAEVDSTPWMKNEAIKSGPDAGRIVSIPTQRPYSWSGFSDFMKSRNYSTNFNDYRWNRGGQYTEYAPIMRDIEELFKNQKLEGALVGAFNPTVTMAVLGMKNNTDVTTNGQPINTGPVKVEIVNPQDEDAENL